MARSGSRNVPTPRLTDGQLRHALHQVRIHGGIAPAAKALGMDQGTLRYRHGRALAYFGLPAMPPTLAGGSGAPSPSWLVRLVEWFRGM